MEFFADDPSSTGIEAAVVSLDQDDAREATFRIPFKRVLILLPHMSVDRHGGLVLCDWRIQDRVEKNRGKAQASVGGQQGQRLNVDLM